MKMLTGYSDGTPCLVLNQIRAIVIIDALLVLLL